MRPTHYYGDWVRLLFLVGGGVMLLTLPMVNSLLQVSTAISLATILLLVLSAGLTNPRQERSVILDMIVSAIALVIFGYGAVMQYPSRSLSSTDSWLFWIDLFLAIIFFVAFYFSLKTVRGFKQESLFGYEE